MEIGRAADDESNPGGCDQDADDDDGRKGGPEQGRKDAPWPVAENVTEDEVAIQGQSCFLNLIAKKESAKGVVPASSATRCCRDAYQPRDVGERRGDSSVGGRQAGQVKGVKAEAVGDGAGGRGDDGDGGDQPGFGDADDEEPKEDVGGPDCAEDGPAQLEEDGYRRRHDGR